MPLARERVIASVDLDEAASAGLSASSFGPPGTVTATAGDRCPAEDLRWEGGITADLGSVEVVTNNFGGLPGSPTNANPGCPRGRRADLEDLSALS